MEDNKENFKIEFPDIDTTIIKKDPEFTWSEIFKAVYRKYKRKLNLKTANFFQDNKFTGKRPTMFVFFPNKFKQHSGHYSYYGWFTDAEGVQHNVVLHDSTDNKGRPCLKGTIDYAPKYIPHDEREKNAKGIIPDIFEPEKPQKVEKVNKLQVIPKKSELKAKFGPKKHKPEEDNPLDLLP